MGRSAKLLTDDFAALFEIAPRFSKDQPGRAEISGRDLFINSWASALVGVVTMHTVFLPEITLISPTAANGIWGMHDLVKMPNCVFEGWGHYHDPLRKRHGAWMSQGIQRHAYPYGRTVALATNQPAVPVPAYTRAARNDSSRRAVPVHGELR